MTGERAGRQFFLMDFLDAASFTARFAIVASQPSTYRTWSVNHAWAAESASIGVGCVGSQIQHSRRTELTASTGEDDDSDDEN